MWFSKDTSAEEPKEITDTFRNQGDSRYRFDASEIGELYRFFIQLTAPRALLPLTIATYRTEVVYGPVAQRLVKADQSDFFKKLVAATQVTALASNFIGKPVGKDAKRHIYQFALARFVEHGDDLRIVATAAQNVKHRSKYFPQGSIPSDQLIAKIEAFHADFQERKQRIARGLNPDIPENMSPRDTNTK